MDQRVSFLTLGVGDLDASRSFYERLGWRVSLEVEEKIFFQIGDAILVLWGREKLAADSGVSDPGGWGGVMLAHNVGSRAEVDDVIEEARRAGGRISRGPSETFYGGYAGVFVDPDGHPWEVAHNPGFPLAEDGTITVPEP